MQELFDIGDGMAVMCNPGGRFHGWLFRRHPDGQYVSVRQLETITDPHPNIRPVTSSEIDLRRARDLSLGQSKKLRDR